MYETIESDHLFRQRRAAAVSRHATQIGLDYVNAIPEAEAGTWLLYLHFLPPTTTDHGALEPLKAAAPTSVSAKNIRISMLSGASASHIRLKEILPLDGVQIPLRIWADGQPLQGQEGGALYRLELVDLPHLDPFFAQATFSLTPRAKQDIDPSPAPLPLADPSSDMVIDYLARDYASFRQLMLDRLSLLLGQNFEHNPADLGVALVEAVAYLGDHLSYYQDAVATEAYLGTARRRVSVRRHARLLDYAMHEGCNARVWVQIEVQGDERGLRIEAGTPLLTGLGQGSTSTRTEAETAITRGTIAFETLHAAELFPDLNQLYFYAWGARSLILPKGATSATLRGLWRDSSGGWRNVTHLRVGDVLVFEQRRDVAIASQPGSLKQRQALRLTRVSYSEDVLGDDWEGGLTAGAVPIIEIEWAADDALRFELPLVVQQGNQIISDSSIACGNIVLADHGHRMISEYLPPAPPLGGYRPYLQQIGLTFRAPYDHQHAQQEPASAAIRQDPRRAGPALTLYDAGDNPFSPGGVPPSLDDAGATPTGAIWQPRHDLLRSDRFARDFVVELENDGRVALRFGDDSHGRRPPAGVSLSASYRIGNGPQGNVGPESISRLVTDDSGIAAQVVRVRNPLPAEGGRASEPIEQVRLAAPAAFHGQERCITAEDFATAAARHPGVGQAAAVLRWTGSWYTAFVAVTRRDDLLVDAHFRAELLAFLQRFRPAGADIEVRAPHFVPLQIVLPVRVIPSAFRSTVRQALRENFSAVDLPSGQRGFFHPHNFAFGQPVYLSQIIRRAMQTPGVQTVSLDPALARFQPWGRSPQDELQTGQIAVGPLEMVRLSNKVTTPQEGTIEFIVEGGT